MAISIIDSGNFILFDDGSVQASLNKPFEFQILTTDNRIRFYNSTNREGYTYNYSDITVPTSVDVNDLAEIVMGYNNTALGTLSNNTFIEIARTGKYMGKTAYAFNILGRRAGFTSTSVYNDVKEYDNSVANIPVLSNSTLDIISSNANDTIAGTGVRQVKVVYIDNSNNLVESAAINLNGTTLVTSVLTGVNFVLWMEAVTVGSGNVAAGNIRLRINGGTIEVEQITAGGNKSRGGAVMIPTGYTGYITSLQGTAVSTTQNILLRATVNTLDRSLSSVYHYVDNLYLTDSQVDRSDFHSLKLPALCKVKVSTISGATGVGNRADVSFNLILIAD